MAIDPTISRRPSRRTIRIRKSRASRCRRCRAIRISMYSGRTANFPMRRTGRSRRPTLPRKTCSGCTSSSASSAASSCNRPPTAAITGCSSTCLKPAKAATAVSPCSSRRRPMPRSNGSTMPACAACGCIGIFRTAARHDRARRCAGSSRKSRPMAGTSPITSAAPASSIYYEFIASIEAPVVIDHMGRIDIAEGLNGQRVPQAAAACSTAAMSG